jgi:D-beta-D-heptose 7-phosphate kinase/D-beta-D-heptose 1-phosphate adenosyltransferase
VGDLMVDRSCRGPAERISPEAPVPVVHVQEEVLTPGGAGNVINNLAVLGACPSLISVRGDDATGETFTHMLKSCGANTSGILVDPTRPTITKTRVFAGHQQVARFDFEKRGGLSSQNINHLLKFIDEQGPSHKAIIISDYGKGVVVPSVIKKCLQIANKHRIPVIVDPKIEHFLLYKGVDCITPNTKEAIEGLRSLPPKTENDVLALGDKILKKLKCHSLLLTRGEKGMSLFQKGKRPLTIPAIAQAVFDVTGAGDTVISTFSLARAVRAPFEEAAYLANVAASLVVAKVGTAVCTREELIDRVKSLR